MFKKPINVFICVYLRSSVDNMFFYFNNLRSFAEKIVFPGSLHMADNSLIPYECEALLQGSKEVQKISVSCLLNHTIKPLCPPCLRG